MSTAPEGFEPHSSSPFFDAVGPVWVDRRGETPAFGMYIEHRHCNTSGTAHGAILSGLADLTLGHGIRATGIGDARLVTASLTIDFAAPVPEGAWIEGAADVQRLTKRSAFANCYLVVDGVRAVRASGVYTMIPRD